MPYYLYFRVIKVDAVVEVALVIVVQVEKGCDSNLYLKEFKKTNFNNKGLNMDN